MNFDLSDSSDVIEFKRYCDYLIKNEKPVSINEVREQRSISQNGYLHLILSYFALETGYRLNEVKQDIFKRKVCREFFIVVENDKVSFKSTKDLNTEEFSQATEKFRNWSSLECSIYLPSPNEHILLNRIKNEISKNRQYL